MNEQDLYTDIISYIESKMPAHVRLVYQKLQEKNPTLSSIMERFPAQDRHSWKYIIPAAIALKLRKIPLAQDDDRRYFPPALIDEFQKIDNNFALIFPLMKKLKPEERASPAFFLPW